METKYIFITGGVVSSLGKGVTGASLGRLLKSRGYTVAMMKFDPYINVDPGTMNPFQHGEVFVTEDGLETDLDLGHYERFADVTMARGQNITTGRIYNDLIDRERQGVYMGGTLQVIPHVTGAIQEAILDVAKKQGTQFVIVEIGGTVGDIESLPFLEAICQMERTVGRNNCFYIHVTLVPYVRSAGELKTKPTQHSVRDLCAVGIQPDALICRSDRPLDPGIKNKIAFLCNLDPDCVIENSDAPTIYQVPLILEREGLANLVLRHVGLPNPPPDLSHWEEMVDRLLDPQETVNIGVVGKYVGLKDAYFSIAESFIHAGCFHKAKVNAHWIEAEEITAENAGEKLSGMDGILVPGGFGERGVEGMIQAIRHCRENGVPLGICLGMQMAVVEYARFAKGMEKAHSTEMNPNTPDPVIDLMEEQNGVTRIGGTMRLGRYDCEIAPNSLAARIYGETAISERHRHRYEFNPSYVSKVIDDDFQAVGFNPQLGLCEIIELKRHPFFLRGAVPPGVQVPAGPAPPPVPGVHRCGYPTQQESLEIP